MLSIQELRSSSKKELQAELQKARATTLKIRISLKTKHEKDTSKSKKAKAYVAQIMTMLNQLGKEPSSVHSTTLRATEALAKSEASAVKSAKSVEPKTVARRAGVTRKKAAKAPKASPRSASAK